MSDLLGISRSKEAILLSLIGSTPLTAGEVSRKTGLELNKVYELMKELVAERFVEPIPAVHRPHTFCLSRSEVGELISKRRDTLTDILSKISAVEERLSHCQIRSGPTLSKEVWDGPVYDALPQTLKNFREARKSILISTYLFSWYDDVEDILEAKRTQRVDIRVLMVKPNSEIVPVEHRFKVEERIGLLRRLGAKVFLSDTPPPFRGSIVDDRVCLVMMFPYPMNANSDTSTAYCLLKNSALIEIVSSYFHMFLKQ